MKLLIVFILRYFICLAGNRYSNIIYVSKLTLSQLSPLLPKVHSQYQIIITIFTIGKNNLETLVASV